MNDKTTGEIAKQICLDHYRKVLTEARQDACVHRYVADEDDARAFRCIKPGCNHMHYVDPVLWDDYLARRDDEGKEY